MSGTDNLKQRTVGPMEVEAGEEKAKLKGEEILDPVSASERRHKKVEKAFTWIWNKIQSAMWVTGAVAVIYYSNFFKVIFDSPRANRIFVNIALLGIGINVTLTIYVAFILPHVLKIKESFETYCPRVVVIGTISGVTSFITMIIGIWPLWGWLSPLMLFVMFMGFISSSSFLPGNDLGSILLGVVFVGAFISDRFIEHEGHWH